MNAATFAATWRWTLPLGLLLSAIALVYGFFSAGSAPAWFFIAGAILVVLGVAAFLTGLSLKARDAIEDVLDGDDDPSGPTGPKIQDPHKR
jgi:membrane protein YdbS with pleckstrin-like domain